MSAPTCPCEDGLPDPCTLCGEPADGICRLNTLIGWKHRAETAEAERDALAAKVRELDERLDACPPQGTVDYLTDALERAYAERDTLAAENEKLRAIIAASEWADQAMALFDPDQQPTDLSLPAASTDTDRSTDAQD